MAGMESFIPELMHFMVGLVYIAVFILFIAQKDNKGRAKVVMITAGILAIIYISTGSFDFLFYNPGVPFAVTQVALLAYLSIWGVSSLLDSKMVIVLLAVFFICMQLNVFAAMLIGIGAYAIVMGGLVLAAFKLLRGRMTEIKAEHG